MTGRWGMWLNGWSSSNNTARRGSSARLAQSMHSATCRPALIRQMKTTGPLRRSVPHCQGDSLGAGGGTSQGLGGQGTGSDRGG